MLLEDFFRNFIYSVNFVVATLSSDNQAFLEGYCVNTFLIYKKEVVESLWDCEEIYLK